MLPIPFPPFLPFAAIEVSDHGILAILALAALMFAATLTDAVTSVWARFKRSPTIDAEFATKHEVRELEIRIERKIESGFIRLGNQQDRLERTLSTFAEDMSRSIGKLEGRLEGGSTPS